MKVIVALISDPELEDYENPIDIKVRKCPPNYEQRYSSNHVEWIVELDDEFMAKQEATYEEALVEMGYTLKEEEHDA